MGIQYKNILKDYNGVTRERKATSSLYRTAEEARSGLSSSYAFVDGIRFKTKTSYPQKKSFFRYKDFFSQKRFAFDVQALFFLMGKRGIAIALIIGMIMMGSFTHFLGQRVWAENISPAVLVVQQRVLGAETMNDGDIDKNVSEFENGIREMVEGYPIEDMIPYIMKQDKRVSAYLVAIAKKESNWGKRIPVYYGENCFNYWGYRGQDEIMGSAGHTCFDTPKEAVTIVARRLNTLVIKQGLSSASDLIVWKCGSSCAGHDPYGVQKWISDVDGYYQELIKLDDGK